MPPQIVGSADGVADAETFVIGDEEDAEDEGFEYVHDVEIAPASSTSSSPQTDRNEGLRNTGIGSPRGPDIWDQAGPPIFAGPVE